MPQTIDPKACSDEQRLRLPNNGTAPQPSDRSNQTLSEKLERSDGVVCPPAGVDPEITVPPTGVQRDSERSDRGWAAADGWPPLLAIKAKNNTVTDSSTAMRTTFPNVM